MSERKTILLIEDDMEQISMYECAFRLGGYEVIAVRNREELGLILPTCQPDLVLLDFLLGDEEAVDWLDELKGQLSEEKRIEVVIFSNYWKTGIEDHCRQAGATDYLLKSKFLPREIVDRIAQYLV